MHFLNRSVPFYCLSTLSLAFFLSLLIADEICNIQNKHNNITYNMNVTPCASWIDIIVCKVLSWTWGITNQLLHVHTFNSCITILHTSMHQVLEIQLVNK